MTTRIKKTSILIVAILIAEILLTGFVTSSSSFANSTVAAKKFIGEERAKEIALSDSKVSASNAKYLHAYLDRDDRIDNYDVKFYYDGKEYEYEINASTGTILDKSVEREYIAGNQNATPAAQQPANTDQQTPDASAAPAATVPESAAPSGTKPSNNAYYYDYDDDWDDRYDDDRYDDDWDDRYDDDRYDDDWDDRYDDDDDWDDD